MANNRRPISFVNRTNYFSPSVSRSHVRLSSPNSFAFVRSKIEGYESRLFWQFKFCEDNGYPVFFYTLTYNNRNIPDFFGVPCFDYEHLRSLFTGGFYKQLKRKYGCTFRYFVGAELGDGKGSRGYHNNPHYHVLFFLEPAKGCELISFPSPEEFRHLVRLYWQGFDEDEGFRDYETALYGIAREGLYCGLVKDFRACTYCAKYVVKDTGLKAFEFDVISLLKDFFRLNCPADSEENPFCYELRLAEFVRNGINEFRNRFCNKVRISHGVGDYALKHIVDKLNPSIPIPAKNGYKNRPISLYYYRKLYCDVVKDSGGRNLYLLNDLGVEYKVSQLSKRLAKFSDSAKTYLSLVEKDIPLFNKILTSDVNVEVRDSSSFLLSYLKNVFPNEQSRTELFRRYAEYKLVYQDRFFKVEGKRDSLFFRFPLISPSADYRSFLRSSFFMDDLFDGGASAFVANVPEGWLSYDTHPYFLRYIRFFPLFDLLSDYFFIQSDVKQEEDEEERRRIRRFHNDISLSNYYSNKCFAYV